MSVELAEQVLETIKSACQKLTGYRRRQFQAEVAERYCDGIPRRAETVFGWGRDAVQLGLHERRTGIRCGASARPSLKKLPETDAIFAHLQQVHTQVATDPQTLRISLDTKAKVKIGEFSRHGVAHRQKAVAAADHDMHPNAILAPAGILEVDSGQLNVVFGTSRNTSDFVADCLDLWWTNRQTAHPHVRRRWSPHRCARRTSGRVDGPWRSRSAGSGGFRWRCEHCRPSAWRAESRSPGGGLPWRSHTYRRR